MTVPALSTSASKKSSGDSCPMVHFNIQPMERIINFQTHIKISLTDKSATDAETKKALCHRTFNQWHGHVEICAKTMGQNVRILFQNNNNGIL